MLCDFSKPKGRMRASLILMRKAFSAKLIGLLCQYCLVSTFCSTPTRPCVRKYKMPLVSSPAYFWRTTVSYASVMGIIQDNNIDTNSYSHLALTFYVTFLFFELPQGYALQHFPTAKYLGVNGKQNQGTRIPTYRLIKDSYTMGDMCYS
jgi:hypothetical protein